MKQTYVIGVDYGTDSVRALLVDALTGEVVATSVAAYSRWSRGLYCRPDEAQFRQHPMDYIEGLECVLSEVVKAHPEAAASVRAIAVDTTASTPCLVDQRCRPLALRPEYNENPDAMFVLWKDHTAQREAEQITALCASSSVNYARHSGNHYSSECFWAKTLHLLRGSEELRRDAWTVVELCDWIPALLTGCDDMRRMRAGRCVAGVKQMWAEEWGGFPPAQFFEAIDPLLVPIVGRLQNEHYGCDSSAGYISDEWAAKLGLSRDVQICVGNIDSYSGAVGAGITAGTVVLNLGTSACYMALMPPERMKGAVIDGIFGQVDDAIVTGMVGFEAGLSAFGDVYAWFKRLLCWSLSEVAVSSEQIDSQIMSRLTQAAQQLPQRVDAPQATDYFNGRRSPSPCNTLTATLSGLTLGTSAPEIYYALTEATVFATRAVIDHLAAGGVEIDTLIGIGGISQKSPFVMQMIADVTGMEVSVSDCHHSCALGAVIHAATVAGAYASVADAQRALCPEITRTYRPDASKAEIFAVRYAKYLQMAQFAETTQMQ